MSIVVVGAEPRGISNLLGHCHFDGRELTLWRSELGSAEHLGQRFLDLGDVHAAHTTRGQFVSQGGFVHVGNLLGEKDVEHLEDARAGLESLTRLTTTLGSQIEEESSLQHSEQLGVIPIPVQHVYSEWIAIDLEDVCSSPEDLGLEVVLLPGVDARDVMFAGAALNLEVRPGFLDTMPHRVVEPVETTEFEADDAAIALHVRAQLLASQRRIVLLDVVPVKAGNDWGFAVPTNCAGSSIVDCNLGMPTSGVITATHIGVTDLVEQEDGTAALPVCLVGARVMRNALGIARVADVSTQSLDRRIVGILLLVQFQLFGGEFPSAIITTQQNRIAALHAVSCQNAVGAPPALRRWYSAQTASTS